MSKPDPTQDSLREQLAAIEHERWGDWQAWLMSQRGIEQRNGDIVLKATDVTHWRRQIDTPYDRLSESEKDSDREQVDRYLPLVDQAVTEAVREFALEVRMLVGTESCPKHSPDDANPMLHHQQVYDQLNWALEKRGIQNTEPDTKLSPTTEGKEMNTTKQEGERKA